MYLLGRWLSEKLYRFRNIYQLIEGFVIGWLEGKEELIVQMTEMPQE